MVGYLKTISLKHLKTLINCNCSIKDIGRAKFSFSKVDWTFLRFLDFFLE